MPASAPLSPVTPLQLLLGALAKAPKKSPTMQTEWELDAELGDGINENTVIPQNSSRIPHGPPLYDFILNFQAPLQYPPPYNHPTPRPAGPPTPGHSRALQN